MPICDEDMSKVFVRGIGVAEGTGDVIAEIVEKHQYPNPPSYNAHYYLPNHRGDTLLVLSGTGTEECRIRYDAFGNVKEQTGTFSPTYTFSTKEFLPDAKLYLYAYRVYDPIAGRWTQRDPIDYQDSVNLYQFCGNNPVNKVDPNGQVAILAVLGVAATGIIAGGAVSYGLAHLRVRLDPDYNSFGAYATTPFWYAGIFGDNFISRVTVKGNHYDDLSNVAKYIVDEHEKVHQKGHYEIEAHKKSYELADQILKDKKWNGKELSKNELAEVSGFKNISRSQLEHRMGKKKFKKWDKNRKKH